MSDQVGEKLFDSLLKSQLGNLVTYERSTYCTEAYDLFSKLVTDLLSHALKVKHISREHLSIVLLPR